MGSFFDGRMLNEFLFGFGTLFAIINPYGLAFVFLEWTRGLSDHDRAIVARQIALHAFGVLVVSLFAGTAILGFFGVSLPALRVAGGLVVALAGWSMVNQTHVGDPSDVAETLDLQSARKMVFFPLTVPLTTGPGTIAAAIALAANRQGDLRGILMSSIASLLVAVCVSLAIFHAYRRAGRMARLLGVAGTLVVTRVSAFLLLCVGIQIIMTGVSDALLRVLQSAVR